MTVTVTLLGPLGGPDAVHRGHFSRVRANHPSLRGAAAAVRVGWGCVGGPYGRWGTWKVEA